MSRFRKEHSSTKFKVTDGLPVVGCVAVDCIALNY